MKPVSEWDENYILHELAVGEFDWLDMKDRRALDLSIPNVSESQVRENLSKHLSAFANSGGGQLLLGMQDPNISTGRHFVSDGGVEVTLPKKGDTREWLENIISNLMEYPLRKFNVYAITRKDENSEIGEGRAVYVIDIPDSPDAPHQAQDKKYYARVGGRSQTIGHRLIMDIANRRQSPKITLEFRINASKPKVLKTGSSTNTITDVFLRTFAFNQGKVLANYAEWEMWIPLGCLENAASHEVRNQFYNEPTAVIIDLQNRMSKKFGIFDHYYFSGNNRRNMTYDPILPNRHYAQRERISSYWYTHRNSYSEDLGIYWTVYADNAPPEEGFTKLSDIKIINAGEEK